VLFKKYKIREQKGRGLSHLTYFLFWDPLNISGTAKAKNFQKLSMGMTGISGQSLHRGSGAEPIVGGARECVRGALPPKLKICIPGSQFCLQFCSITFWRC